MTLRTRSLVSDVNLVACDSSWRLVAAVLVSVTLLSCGAPEQRETEPRVLQTPLGDSPLHATYWVDDEPVRLENGRADRQAAPGSASRVRTEVTGTPALGDLDGDGDEDAALVMWRDGGGSGRFYLLGAALREDGGWRGINTVHIGDRVLPTGTGIQNGVVTVDYLDRRPSEPMAAPPTMPHTLVAALMGDTLERVEAADDAQRVLAGWLTIGHEVRAFRPCERDTEHWVVGEPETFRTMSAAYRGSAHGAPPYMPVFAVLMGRMRAPPADGFGADYDAALEVGAFIHTWPSHCHVDWIRVDAPRAGASIRSPLEIRGKARGNWFFEGDAPVVLLDASGRSVATRFITADGEWMTRDFVPFRGTLEFATPGAGTHGTLVLKRDNPTGRAEHDRAVRIPVRF